MTEKQNILEELGIDNFVDDKDGIVTLADGSTGVLLSDDEADNAVPNAVLATRLVRIATEAMRRRGEPLKPNLQVFVVVADGASSPDALSCTVATARPYPLAVREIMAMPLKFAADLIETAKVVTPVMSTIATAIGNGEVRMRTRGGFPIFKPEPEPLTDAEILRLFGRAVP